MEIQVLGFMDLMGWKIGVSMPTMAQIRKSPVWRLYERQNQLIQNFGTLLGRKEAIVAA